MGKGVDIDRCTPSPEMKVAEANVLTFYKVELACVSYCQLEKDLSKKLG